MTTIYVDATTLIALGAIDELALLTTVDGTLIVLPSVRDEVTTEPAATNLERLLDNEDIRTTPPVEIHDDQARAILDESEMNGDVRLVAAVLAHTEAEDPVAVVSDDQRVRTVADGLGATVTGTIGMIVRAVEAGRPSAEAKELVRQVDDRGLHMTAELRETAMELIEAATDSSNNQ